MRANIGFGVLALVVVRCGGVTNELSQGAQGLVHFPGSLLIYVILSFVFISFLIYLSVCVHSCMYHGSKDLSYLATPARPPPESIFYRRTLQQEALCSAIQMMEARIRAHFGCLKEGFKVSTGNV